MCVQAELQDGLLWLKVVLAVITGVVCGFHVEGAAGLVVGVAVVTGLTTLFIQAYLRVDEDAYGGLPSLLMDSAYVAFAVFLVRSCTPQNPLHTAMSIYVVCTEDRAHVPEGAQTVVLVLRCRGL